MKKLVNSLFVLSLLVFATSCDSDDNDVRYENTNFIQMADSSPTTIVENSSGSIELVVLLASERSEDVTVSFEAEGDASRFQLSPTGGTVTIPAGETSATIEFLPIDNDDIDGDTTVTVSFSNGSGIPVGIGGTANGRSKAITIIDDNLPCNNAVLTVTTDAYPEETTWEVTDSNGTVVASGGDDYGPASSAASRGVVYTHNITLEDGCYTFTIYDVYGDGLFDGAYTGSYSFVCGGNIVYAQGSGAFSNGTYESTDFCVNQ